MASSMFDLSVVGGGPAGSAAAITAVPGGARVLLLERGRLPRHKVCGEFVSAESLELLGSLLRGQHLAVLNDAVRISRTRLYIDGRVIGASVGPPAASIARCDLDAALWESAQLAGVDARQQVTVREIKGRGPFRICSSDGEFESRAVINASGRWSILNGTTAVAEQKWVGLKAHFAESSPEASVDLYFFDGGYCGVQPVGAGRVNACSLVPIFRASSQLRRLLTLPRPARRPLLLVLEKSPKIAEYLVRRTRKAPLEPGLPHHQHFTHIVASEEEFD